MLDQKTTKSISYLKLHNCMLPIWPIYAQKSETEAGAGYKYWNPWQIEAALDLVLHTEWGDIKYMLQRRADKVFSTTQGRLNICYYYCNTKWTERLNGPIKEQVLKSKSIWVNIARIVRCRIHLQSWGHSMLHLLLNKKWERLKSLANWGRQGLGQHKVI